MCVFVCVGRGVEEEGGGAVGFESICQQNTLAPSEVDPFQIKQQM